VSIARSIFVPSYYGFVSVVAVYAGVELLRGMQPWAAWLGLFICTAAPALFFTSALLFPKPRTARHPVEFSLVCGLGLVITMVFNWRYGDASGAIHIWAGACLLGWLVYLRWYSVFPNRNAKDLVKGQTLPEFELMSESGQTFTSSELTGKPHVLVFYRGNWCPFCTAQISELADQYQTLNDMGVDILLISSQPQSHNTRLAARFEAPMRFMRDTDNQAAKTLGIAAPWGTPMGMQLLGYPSETSLPTVIITDSAGRLLWTHQTDNYRLRPEPETYIKILQSAAASTPLAVE